MYWATFLGVKLLVNGEEVFTIKQSPFTSLSLPLDTLPAGDAKIQVVGTTGDGKQFSSEPIVIQVKRNSRSRNRAFEADSSKSP